MTRVHSQWKKLIMKFILSNKMNKTLKYQVYIYFINLNGIGYVGGWLGYGDGTHIEQCSMHVHE